MKSSFFVSGVPCTGKTWLGHWLAEREGYWHVDAEKNNGHDLDTAGIHQEWDQALHTGRAENLVAKLATLSQPVILNWGFPMAFLYFARALQVAGLEVWWIRADPAAARDAFVKCAGIPVQCFDRQITDIGRNALLLEDVFGKRRLEGLTRSGEQRHSEELWRQMQTIRANAEGWNQIRAS